MILKPFRSMKQFVLLCFVFFNHFMWASNNELLIKANDALTKNEFQVALDIYKQIEKSGFGGPGLYQNMALAEVSLHRDPKAILYLEKALKYSPNEKSIVDNLQLIIKRNSEIDSPTSDIEIKTYLNKIVGIFNISTWVTLSLISLFAIGVLGFYNYPLGNIKKPFKIKTIGLVMAFLICTTSGYFRHDMIYNNSGIIITKDNTTLKLGPDETSPEITNLPSGTKVYYQDHLNGWWQISTGYGEKGWIMAANGERI